MDELEFYKNQYTDLVKTFGQLLDAGRKFLDASAMASMPPNRNKHTEQASVSPALGSERPAEESISENRTRRKLEMHKLRNQNRGDE